MSTSTANSLFAELEEKIKGDAYAAGYAVGWRDAIAAMAKATAEVAEQKMPKAPDFKGVLLGAPEVGIQKLPQGNLPLQGSTPWYVIQAVHKKPGMTGAEIVAAVKEGGHNASENSIRTSIFRMKERKFLVARHGKWFSA